MKFRKKPVVIEAIQWTGFNYQEMVDFIQQPHLVIYEHEPFIIKTLEGEHKANVFDWIIKGIKGEFYPCKPDIFEQTYEPVAEVVA